MILPQHYTIPTFEIAALRLNMKAAFKPLTAFLAVSALSRVFNRLAGFVPVTVKYSTDKTTVRRFFRTVDVTIVPDSKFLILNSFSPVPPFKNALRADQYEQRERLTDRVGQNFGFWEVNYE